MCVFVCVWGGEVVVLFFLGERGTGLLFLCVCFCFVFLGEGEGCVFFSRSASANWKFS